MSTLANAPAANWPNTTHTDRPPGPDLLRRVSTLPTTGTRGARLLRSGFRRRRKRPNGTSDRGDKTHGNGHAASVPETRPLAPLTAAELLDTIYLSAEPVAEHDDDLEYDSLATYFLTREDEKALVTREVERLVNVVNNPDTPLALEGSGRLGGGDTVGYSALTALTKMLIDARSICVVDNDGISLVHAPLGKTSAPYRHLMHSLRRICERGEVALPTGPGAVWSTVEERREDAAALMDFVSACLARFTTQVANGTRWRSQQIGALAKFTAKVKFLLEGMADHASVALRNADIALATFEATYGDVAQQQDDDQDNHDSHMAIYQRFAATLSADPAQADHLKGVEDRVTQQLIRLGFMEALRYVLVSLLPGDRHQGFGDTEYEVCGVVMETGFQDFQVRYCSLGPIELDPRS